MAKLKAPLMSLGASGKLGDALVYLPWKGLNNVREYVIPANPRTAAQMKQRGYLTDLVAKVHAAQAHATHPLTAVDTSAYALWASVVKAATTWFNQVVRNGIDQLVVGLRECIFSSGSTVPKAGALDVQVWSIGIAPTGGDFWYGTSKTALINKKGGSFESGKSSATIDDLTKGVKYFWQFRPTVPTTIKGTRSGIYYGTPL
ncbi:hypothetical protein ES708_28312 [subsurface metagenome]